MKLFIRLIFAMLLLALVFLLSSDAQQNVKSTNQSVATVATANTPNIVALPKKSLKKGSGTSSYPVDYWPILWSWYIDVTDLGSQAMLYYKNPKAVNGNWEMEIMYRFQIATDTGFTTVVMEDSMIADRYNYRKWPSHDRKWLDTLGTERPNPDTTYFVTRDPFWVIYGQTYYSRVCMRWFMFQPDYFWWKNGYDSTARMYFYSGGNGPWSNVIEFTMEKPLVVELLWFEAYQDHNRVVLRWKTASEKECAGFFVDRKLPDGSWKELGFVEGHGTTNIHREYSLVDNEPDIYTTNYYQLKQINKTGVVEDLWHTEIDMITELSYAYPNPAGDQVVLPFIVTKEGYITIKIYDVKGVLLAMPVENQFYTIGKHHVEIDTRNYSNGIYIYDLLKGSLHTVNKFLVIR